MKKGFFYIFLLITGHTFSQNLDSLWKVYNNKTQADTERLKAMDEISWSFRHNNPDTAIILAEQQIQLALKTNALKYELSKC